MSFWKRLFGGTGNEPPKPPTGERAGELRDGKKYGTWIERDGKSLIERTYKDGLIQGIERHWSAEGKLHVTVEHVDGKRHGMWRSFRDDGTPVAESAYRDGKQHGLYRRFAGDGSITLEQEYREGALWHGPDDSVGKDGFVFRKGRYENGARHGAWEEYHWDRRVKERGTYVAGKRQGPFELGEDALMPSLAISWRGSFDHDERDGEWEMRRQDKLVARGEWPRGAPVSWEVHDGDRHVSIEVTTSEMLPRWIALGERWLEGRSISDAIKGWSREERARAQAWLDAQLAAAPRDEEPDQSTAGERADRMRLIDAIGDVKLPRRPAGDRPGDADSYMTYWSPTRRLLASDLGTIELPQRAIVTSPDLFDLRDVRTFAAGTYRVVGIGDPDDRLSMPAVVIRKPGHEIARWCSLGTASDDMIVVTPAGIDPARVEFPGRREGVSGPAEWVNHGRTDDGEPYLWIDNPTGNGIHAFAGLAASGETVVVFMQLY